MTHIHIPDGVLPFWLWAGAWALAVGVLWSAERFLPQPERARRLPLLGAAAALVLVAMSVEVVPIAYHINLTVIAGVLVGPALGAVAAFVVSVILALLGHGGITVAGLNTLLLGTEIALGGIVFRALARALKRRRVFAAGFVAVVLTLAVTSAMLVGIVWLAGPQWVEQPAGALDVETLAVAEPLREGLVAFRFGEEEAEEEAPGLSIERFATIVFVLGPVGWVLEGLITGGVLAFLARVRPELVVARPSMTSEPRLVGDEHGGR